MSGCHPVLPSHHCVGNTIVFFTTQIHEELYYELYRLLLISLPKTIKSTRNLVNAGSTVRLVRFNIVIIHLGVRLS
ncbi:hypothetical protein F4813DRAFT_357007 [Daldinia decipiens]|uniref:uncharacterized protein n=1 Tax=Daldinia decipiens TaxID=326647 RepID=UPI0020C34B5D|nr:uncharacterized protein F4813DRAFT_357007 [Daldinia decipiens]KAI1658509.1 hypothetical protein F4813DRAFT_357007 [Daldinia decipiens]